MPSTDRPLDPELRAQLQALRDGGRSLRKLAAQLGVNYFVVYKGVHGKKVRPSTEREIREGVERVFGGAVGRAVGDLLRAIELELGSERARKVEGWLRRGLAEAYRAEGRIQPVGLLKQSVSSSRRLAELQRKKKAK
jgi:transposase